MGGGGRTWRRSRRRRPSPRWAAAGGRRGRAGAPPAAPPPAAAREHRRDQWLRRRVVEASEDLRAHADGERRSLHEEPVRLVGDVAPDEDCQQLDQRTGCCAPSAATRFVSSTSGSSVSTMCRRKRRAKKRQLHACCSWTEETFGLVACSRSITAARAPGSYRCAGCSWPWWRTARLTPAEAPRRTTTARASLSRARPSRRSRPRWSSGHAATGSVSGRATLFPIARRRRPSETTTTSGESGGAKKAPHHLSFCFSQRTEKRSTPTASEEDSLVRCAHTVESGKRKNKIMPHVRVRLTPSLMPAATAGCDGWRCRR